MFLQVQVIPSVYFLVVVKFKYAHLSRHFIYILANRKTIMKFLNILCGQPEIPFCYFSMCISYRCEK